MDDLEAANAARSQADGDEALLPADYEPGEREEFEGALGGWATQAQSQAESATRGD